MILENSRPRIWPVEKSIGASYYSLVLPLVYMSLGCQTWDFCMLNRRHDSELILYLSIDPFEANEIFYFFFFFFWMFVSVLLVFRSESAWSSQGATLKPRSLLRVRYSTCRTKMTSMQSLVVRLQL